MPILTRTGLSYPAKGQSRSFAILARLYEAFDSIFYAHREDRNLILMGGGTVTWTAGTDTLTWSSDLIIFSPQKGYHELIEVASSPLTIGDGSLVYVTLTRSPSANVVLTPRISNVVPNDDNSVLLTLRNGTDLYWRNGILMPTGFSGQLGT